MLDQLLNRELWWTGTDLSVVTVLHVGKIWQGHCFWEGKGISLLLSPLSWSVLLTVSSIGGFWNLDFFRYYLPFFCITGRWIIMLQVVALEYNILVAFYPFFSWHLSITWLNVMTEDVYAQRPDPSIKCFSRFRRTWQLKGSVLNAFITFLTLSSAKLLTVYVTLIMFIELKDSCNCGHNQGRKVHL